MADNRGGERLTKIRWRTDRDVKNLPAPADKPHVRYLHSEIERLYCTVTKGGARSFAVKYGRGSLFTFGSYPSWNAKQAEEEGKRLNRLIDQGGDPQAEKRAHRDAPTINALCDLYEAEHLAGHRDSTQAEYKRMLRRYIRPWLGAAKVTNVSEKEVKAELREMANEHPYQSNRVRALLSVLFELAIKEKMRPDNPVKETQPAHEEGRERYLTEDEVSRLVAALRAHPAKISAAAILFLSLTGSRRGETLRAKWVEFDIDRGVWVKPSANVKGKRQHRTPISSAAMAVLREMQTENERLRKEGIITPYVFPSDKRPAQPLTDVKRTWATVRKQAGLEDVRLHDLRHSFASALVSNGYNLPTIGAMLGHSQPRTTARYSHLYDTTLRDAAEKIGAMIVPLGKRA